LKSNERQSQYRKISDTIHRALAAAGLLRGREAQGRTFEGDVRPVHEDEVRTAHAEFLTRSFTNSAGTRTYKLYVPASVSGMDAAVPLVLMLHGCSQTPDDFAAGTRMNVLAERHRFLVAYPAQSDRASKARCWNWFRAQDQGGAQGEPAILAGIARDIMSSYRVDPSRVFVAGMSAGGAMALILGATHRELFAAVGAHSGLPVGAARDVTSALGAMKNGGTAPGTIGIPTIVFHGGADKTVVARNGEAIVEQATRGYAQGGDLRREVHSGRSGDGRAYSRTVYADSTGRPFVEHWVIPSAGHAWSGGSTNGSFTDAGGPDASEEMIRFFLSQPQRLG